MTTTFIILTYRRRELLTLCLRSLVAAQVPGNARTIVGLNGGADKGECAQLSTQWPWVDFVLLPGLGRGEARNRLVDRATSDWVYFLDDDASVPPDFLARLNGAISRHSAAVVLGGPNLGPSDAGAFERAVDFLLRSPLGAGPMRRRYAPVGVERAAPGWSYMLSGMAARREIFLIKELRFPSDCVSAEENLFMHRVEKARGPGVYCPELVVFHRRRSTLKGFLSQVFINGMGRAQITRAAPGSLHWSVTVPSACLVALAALGAAAPVWAARFVTLYFIASIFEGLRLGLIEGDWRAVVWLTPMFALAHGAYVAGFWRGMLEARSKKRM